MEHDRHWHYFGASFLTVGICILGVGSLAVYSGKPPRPDLWTTWYAGFAYLSFALATVCGIGAAAGWAFPLVAAANRLARVFKFVGKVIAVPAYLNPFTWKGFPVGWRGFPWARTKEGLVILAAIYGRPGKEADVAAVLSALISEDQVLDFIVNNETLGGDPAPDEEKNLRLRWSFNGKRDAASFDEYTHVVIPRSAVDRE